MVAGISQERRRLRLVYTEDAIRQYELGVPLLSLSLPLTGQRYPHGIVRAFLDGLLPEGDARACVVSSRSGYTMCGVFLARPGWRVVSVAPFVIQLDDAPPPPQPTT